MRFFIIIFCFPKNDIIFSSTENVNWKSSPYSLYNDMLYHFEKSWNAARNHFVIPTNFLTREQWAKAKWKEKRRGRPSNVDNQALLAGVEDDESLTTRILAEYFNVDRCSLSQKTWKIMEICYNFHRFAARKKNIRCPL